MSRRLVIAALPALVVAAVLTLLLDTSSGPPRLRPRTALATPRHRAQRSHRRPALPAPPIGLRGGAARRAAIPILTFHVIGTPPPTAPYPQLWVTPTTFAAEMRALRRAGYWAITLQRAWDAWTRGAPLPRRPVVVSFDDGYRGDYTHARPVLRALGWPGVLNLELHDVGPRNLRASEVRGLIRAGWEIDSHTIDHPDLTTVSGARLRWELAASRDQLRRRFGVHAQFFCYPYGRYDPAVEAAVQRAGYKAATTEDEGFATPVAPYALRRVRVSQSDTPATLVTRLAAAGRYGRSA